MSNSLRAARSRFGIIVTLAGSLLLLTATPAAAHTEFESSSPANETTVDQPVSEISITFAGEASPSGDGFVVLDAEGVERIPDEITSSDNLTWSLRFDEPLIDGTIGVRWKVAAPDAHPIEGTFSFTVAAGIVPTTEPAPASESSSTETTTVPDASSIAEPEVGIEDADGGTELADFLNTSDSSAKGVGRVGDIARILTLLGVVLAVGGVAFTALTLRGDRGDIRATLYWVRRAGLATAVGAVVEGIAQVANVGAGWSSLWTPSTVADALGSSFGIAILMRLVGGVLVAIGADLATEPADSVADPVVAIKRLAGVGAGHNTVTAAFNREDLPPGEPFLHRGDEAWQIRRSPAAFAGALVVVMSFLFDGHTVSEGPRAIHAIANAVHVATAATWAGGVVMLAMVIARRHSRNADTRALQLAVRFSVVATISLVAAALAGTALTVIILDSISELWTTSWGRLLIAKVILVGTVAAGGGYNHRIVIPALEQSPGDEAVADRFRTVVKFEAAVLLMITALTAILIAASST